MSHPLIKHFEENTEGLDFVVGDIHGCFSKLKMALDDLFFDESKDRLFSVGDLVDRGFESADCLDWLAKPWFHAALGNHEDMLINWANNPTPQNAAHYRANGGEWAILIGVDKITPYVEAFSKLPLAIDIKTKNGLVGIVHADPALTDWSELNLYLSSTQDIGYLKDHLVWSRKRISEDDETPVKNVSKVYVGHTVVNQPYKLGNVYYIDTGSVFGRELTIKQI